MKHTEKKGTVVNRILSIVGIVLCVIFGFFLICNLTIIIKGSLNPAKPPSVLGTTPMVVLSGSMSGAAEDHIEVGDLIFVGKAEPEELKVGDVIAFMEENSQTVVTHRIIEVKSAEDGTPFFITKGDANNVEDESPVTVDRLVGIYQFRIAGVGNFAMFLQTPIGMLLFIGVPLLAFIIYDILRRQHYANKEKSNTKALEEEIERLKAIASKQSDEN
ncbi:MAG: signal peptidase I [Faecalimonas sp.]|nr:signal peptidase I [Faecalimonas sp.]